ncbi:alpha/beta hydrolase [uncultured Nocardioides sp.]|uniref:alpha/beta fold hydrolase n=1 Tax=uncultured Nocardioides sp. TaxID=198441 RepID=UPI00262F7521|nr:alpha/beta hydrolase [uncultured Nocardioides sp.]
MARLAERLGGMPAFRDPVAPETLPLLQDHALADWRDVVRRFPLPLLMIAGRESQVWPCEHAEAAVADTAHGRALVVEDAGHAVSIDQPDAFNEALLAFLAETVPA